jgi:hypothetical protein
MVSKYLVIGLVFVFTFLFTTGGLDFLFKKLKPYIVRLGRRLGRKS